MGEQQRISFVSRVLAEDFDYQAEADKTCTVHWNPQNVNVEDFRRTLKHVVELAAIVNLYKKLLFRGVDPGAIHMRVPEFSESLAGNGGHIPGNEIDLVHGVVGVVTEAGEAAEILLDLLEGKPADRVNAIEESGDLRWYVNRILRWADCTDLQCEMTNIDKLHGRHGSTFDVFRDANRDLQRERERLAAATKQPDAPKLDLGDDGPTIPARRYFGSKDDDKG